MEALEKLSPNDPLAMLDTDWMESKAKKVKVQTDQLEHELKTYKNNLIKESIRVCDIAPLLAQLPNDKTTLVLR